MSSDQTSVKEGPLFIVGMNGSGTSMMLNHLGHHPELFAYPLETYILPYFMRVEERYGDLEQDDNFRRLWDDIRCSYTFRWKTAGQPFELPEHWLAVPRSAAGIFDRIMQTFAEREGKSRWAEKTPMHVLHILQLANAFPGSRFIHMIRDGRDCAASDHRRWGRHPAASIYRWKSVVLEGQRQGSLIADRYLELRYEAVTQDPEKYMRLACEFSHLPYDNLVLRTERSLQHFTGQRSKTIVTNSTRNVGYFRPAQRRSLENIAGRTLDELGYKTEYCKGDYDPSAVIRGWWSVHDAVRILLRHLKMKLTVQKRMTWRLLLQRWKMILLSKLFGRPG